MAKRKGPRPRPLDELFWAKVDLHGPVPEHRSDLGPCWLWTGALYRNGYGSSTTAKRHGLSGLTHRTAYMLLVGPIPEKLTLDHLCRVRPCVKPIPDEYGPAHLEVATNAENILRGDGWSGLNARKTHCVAGHPFDEVNTYVRPDGLGRDCRQCRQERMAAWEALYRPAKSGLR